MSSNPVLAKRGRVALALAALLVLAGIAADRPVPQGAVTLAYQFPAGKALSYQEAGTQTQSMDVMGQSMVTTSVSSMDFTVQLKSMKGQDFELGVVIDAAKSDVQTAQGPMSPDMSTVIGKGFDLTVGRLGKELDFSGATALKVSTPNGERDISSTFQAFFPDLPDKPVKVGDTWPSEDTVVQKEGAGETQVHAVHQNTLDGFETVDGYECARIKVVSTGTVSGNLEQQGMGMTLAIKTAATGVFFFAVKEGIYIKSDIKGTMNGTIEIGAPANMSIAITGETTGQTKLLKK
jgi:hypothetical protein